MTTDLQQLPAFENIPAHETDWLLEHGSELDLAGGDFFVREGEPGDRFYIVLEGELQITRVIDGQEVAVGTTPRGIIGGEISLLQGEASSISACAIMPTRLLVLDEAHFRQMFGPCPTFSAYVLRIATGRMQGVAINVKQHEKMMALGKLSAGLAHELNNPAAAVRRAANTLREVLPELQSRAVTLHTFGLSGEQIGALVACQQHTNSRAATGQRLSPLEQSEREDEMGDWLEDQGAANAWDLAASFVAADLRVAELAGLVDKLPPASVGDVLAWLHATLSATGLLNEIDQSTRRISDLVQAIKEYTYMDRAIKPMQEVDIHAGLETTLTVLSHRVKKITLVREYDQAMPAIMARGNELNQVWTNIIDNAIDAVSEQGSQGTVRLITRCENNFAMVEVADNGPGIPPDVMPHLFEPFFTTKEVGVGTGLGLDISYRIIMQHSGTIEVQSEPGSTRFIIRLPVGTASDEAGAPAK